MKSKLNGAIALMCILSAPLSANAGEGSVGNGGGGWVCREKNGDLRWVRVVDLFEAESEFGLTVAKLPGSYTDIVDLMQARLFKADRELFEALSKHFDQVSYLDSSQVHPTEDTLEIINDSLYRLKPQVSKCAGGMMAVDPKTGQLMIPYEQIVNFKHDGSILLQKTLFNQLTETEKAALVFHEAIYAYRRTLGDQNSLNSRRIVGLIFSTLPANKLKEELSKVSQGEAVALPANLITPGTYLTNLDMPNACSSLDVVRYGDQGALMLVWVRTGTTEAYKYCNWAAPGLPMDLSCNSNFCEGRMQIARLDTKQRNWDMGYRLSPRGPGLLLVEMGEYKNGVFKEMFRELYALKTPKPD